MFRRLRIIGILIGIGRAGKFRIGEAVFRFSADGNVSDEEEAQLRLIRDGKSCGAYSESLTKVAC